jgi:spore coat protein H
VRAMLTLALLLVSVAGVSAAAPPVIASVKGEPGEVYGLTKVWTMHLTIQAKDWETMHPTRGGWGGRPQPGKQPAPLSEDRKPRGGFGFDFEYVKGELSIDGARLKDVGVRFKGNSSYSSQPGLKKPFRIDFDRYLEDQTFKGVTKISLNNLIMDPSGAREALGFALYRQAGVPAPRTAIVELFLTVPGKHRRESLGQYTLIEGVDKEFFKTHFGTTKGVVFKPERVGPLDYLGEDWKVYESRYRPRPEADVKSQRRLIDLCWLVQRGDDKTFREQIGRQIDIDRFLRYLACTVLLSSMDSFVGLGHNYYLYLDPKTDKFVFLPWDLDHSFGGLNMLGTSATLSDLSVTVPHLGRNRLVDRLLADEKHLETYKGHLRALMKTAFTADGVKRDLESITALTAPIREREQEEMKNRRESKPGGMIGVLFTASSNLPLFVSRRVASVEAQLAGKSKGQQLNWGFGATEPGWLALAKPALDAADGDRDGKLTKSELIESAKALFKSCDPDGKGALDEKSLTAALVKLLPKPHNRTGTRGLPAILAKALIERAGKDGKLTADALTAFAEKAFATADLAKSGKADERGVAEALRQLMPQSQPATDLKDKKKEDRK